MLTYASASSSRQRNLKIVAVPSRPPTKKEQRGDAKKWTLEHLPRGTASLFTSDVVPLARADVARLEPWERLSVAQLQAVVTRVFPREKDTDAEEGDTDAGPRYVVTKDGPWWGLLQYRLHNYRNGYVQQADKGMLLLHKTHQEDSEEEDAVEEAPDPATDPSDAASTGKKAPAFKFDTPEGRAEFARWALEAEVGGPTMCFHWNQWGDGKEKKGFFLSYLIVHAYAHHLNMEHSIPARYARSEERPYGALLLAVQAVECNLMRWRTGTYTVERGTAGSFSDDNWGDIKTRTSKSTQIKVTRRATKFLATIQKWNAKRWDELHNEASQWVEKKRMRTGSSSRGTSDAENIEEVEDEPEVVVPSD
ncbi:hypothetical protein C8R47DRAFT_1168918 [Mycena vitilis]|nr:hypothetical protein C8R47DRAFT_1168918 [Mycena vitilis]